MARACSGNCAVPFPAERSTACFPLDCRRRAARRPRRRCRLYARGEAEVVVEPDGARAAVDGQVALVQVTLSPSWSACPIIEPARSDGSTNSGGVTDNDLHSRARVSCLRRAAAEDAGISWNRAANGGLDAEAAVVLGNLVQPRRRRSARGNVSDCS